jgi:phosphopantothenate---cysteine ligase (CTP)
MNAHDSRAGPFSSSLAYCLCFFFVFFVVKFFGFPRSVMNLLVTAGNTLVPIDRVRGITNIFTGRTGASIARCAWERGHTVTLLTSHPEVVEAPLSERWAMLRYRTFENLRDLMAELVRGGGLDVVIHCAAVSDYLAGGIYSPAEDTHFRPESGRWESEDAAGPALIDRAADKVKSDEPELWLRLVRAPKLIDCIRRDWGFRGMLVKFKLEVGIRDEQLLTIAERSRMHSDADFMVANTLEGAGAYAYIGPLDGTYQYVIRRELAERLLAALEQHPRKHSDG